MSQFTTPCRVEIIGKDLFRIIEPFEYHVGSFPSLEIIHIPVGFITNFASIPYIFRPILSPVDTYAKAAVVHDYLYHTALYERLRCEEIFLEAMTVLKVEPWKKFAVYNSVQKFGWYRWNQLRRRDAKLYQRGL
jgi:hypothetical protein